MERTQSNDPRDLNRHYFNQRQEHQQNYLSMLGGSWSQPPWNGFHPIIGAGYTRYGESDFLSKYAQDGDSGFFFKKGIFGGADPIGSNLIPLNTFEETTVEPTYAEPMTSVIEPPIVQPPSEPNRVDLEMDTNFNAEPQQKATHVPPYSHLLMQGLGQVTSEGSALHEEPFKIPEYKGTLKKSKRY